MLKKLFSPKLVILYSLTIILISLFVFFNRKGNFQSNVIIEQPQTTEESTKQEDLESQLTDINEKINSLPNLEEDIFYKCMEGKEITPENIDICQTNTQEQIFTLSQELRNLENETKSELKNINSN